MLGAQGEQKCGPSGFRNIGVNVGIRRKKTKTFPSPALHEHRLFDDSLPVLCSCTVHVSELTLMSQHCHLLVGVQTQTTVHSGRAVHLGKPAE